MLYSEIIGVFWEIHAYLATYSMEQSPSWEANCFCS